MKLIIDIPDEVYKMRMLWAKSDSLCSPDTMRIAKGVPYEERPQGKWYKNGQSFIDPNKFLSYCCSNCHSDLDEHIRIAPNFCPNCGADMRGNNNAPD